MKRAGEKGGLDSGAGNARRPNSRAPHGRVGHRHPSGLSVDLARCLAENVELEAALARSYNQFMATQCALSAGRIWYVAIVPWRRPDMAVKEIRRVKTLGCAAGIYARGIEWDRPLTHPDHWPIYEEAANQDLPITVHVGNGSSPMIREMFQGVPRPDL